MDLKQCARCILIMVALLFIICQTKCESHNASANTIEIGCSRQSFTLNIPNQKTDNYSRIFFLTVLGTLCLTLLGCLSCVCCCFFRWSTEKAESLDAYAPRTQSIVWPELPEETAHVVELTFLHTPGVVDCLCSACELAKKVRSIQNCLNSTECYFIGTEMPPSACYTKLYYPFTIWVACIKKQIRKFHNDTILQLHYRQLFFFATGRGKTSWQSRCMLKVQFMSRNQENSYIFKMEKSLNGYAEMLLRFLLFVGYPELFTASNYTDKYWLNETQTMKEDDNATISGGYGIMGDIHVNNKRIVSQVEPLMNVALVALLLHILIVVGGIIIYTFVFCRNRSTKRRSLEVNHRLQSPLTLRHVPNSANCRCHGCLVARQILSGLIVQKIINERS
ncbi:uncharacterized protein LOC133845084 [Drosophila sulfurigaster albostrigata]|uniref:uncharacterized protein LOC133845084 n=1 Tax=Drosophila sulfurigaster albostrigata TaxID=89887 RepID=UPI002D21C493|nr:uncharacterized protein LOC133845084 [Drosophila sulfurigaster albostrigata]